MKWTAREWKALQDVFNCSDELNSRKLIHVSAQNKLNRGQILAIGSVRGKANNSGFKFNNQTIPVKSKYSQFDF